MWSCASVHGLCKYPSILVKKLKKNLLGRFSMTCVMPFREPEIKCQCHQESQSSGIKCTITVHRIFISVVMLPNEVQHTENFPCSKVRGQTCKVNILLYACVCHSDSWSKNARWQNVQVWSANSTQHIICDAIWRSLPDLTKHSTKHTITEERKVNSWDKRNADCTLQTLATQNCHINDVSASRKSSKQRNYNNLNKFSGRRPKIDHCRRGEHII